jgi:hypothetical protein
MSMAIVVGENLARVLEGIDELLRFVLDIFLS